MVEPSPIVWVMGVVGGVLMVVGAMLLGMWWVRARSRRRGESPKTVTHIVKRENNPDLLRKYELHICSEGNEPLNLAEFCISMCLLQKLEIHES